MANGEQSVTLVLMQGKETSSAGTWAMAQRNILYIEQDMAVVMGKYISAKLRKL